MSYDTDKLLPGLQRIDVIQLDFGLCIHVYGSAPCAATGSGDGKCRNSWATCQDKTNYDETSSVRTLSLCTAVSELPIAGYIPCLESVSFDPGDISPDDGIGKVSSVTVKFRDVPSDDTAIDPYVTDRTYNPLTQGTLWPKVRAIWPYYQGRTLRWYTGYINGAFSLSNLRMRQYVIESMEGFGRKSGVTIKAKDPVKLADNSRAQFPKKSTGQLAVAISDVATPTTIDITTEETTEYDLYPFESLSCVNMSGECFRYTGTTIVTGGIRLTGVTRGPPSPYVTEQAAHEVGDDVQKCAYWNDMIPPVIIGRLMTLGAEIPDAFVPYATTWTTLYSTWMGSQSLTRLVCEPIGVNEQISEVMMQSNSWGVWWDDVAQVVNYEVFRPAALGEVVVSITDESNIIQNMVTVADDNDRLLNECVFWYGQIDPTKDVEDTTNYTNAVDHIDPDSVDTNAVGSLRTKTIYGAWHASATRTIIKRIARRFISARNAVPFKVTLEFMRKDDSLETADFIDLQTSAIRDASGALLTTRMRVVKADHGKDTVSYTAIQDFTSKRYGLIAPTALAGTTWATATQAQKDTYVFVANNSGYMSDGTPGKRIF